jgi:hypothetical protein
MQVFSADGGFIRYPVFSPGGARSAVSGAENPRLGFRQGEEVRNAGIHQRRLMEQNAAITQAATGLAGPERALPGGPPERRKANTDE